MDWSPLFQRPVTLRGARHHLVPQGVMDEDAPDGCWGDLAVPPMQYDHHHAEGYHQQSELCHLMEQGRRDPSARRPGVWPVQSGIFWRGRVARETFYTPQPRRCRDDQDWEQEQEQVYPHHHWEEEQDDPHHHWEEEEQDDPHHHWEEEEEQVDPHHHWEEERADPNHHWEQEQQALYYHSTGSGYVFGSSSHVPPPEWEFYAAGSRRSVRRRLHHRSWVREAPDGIGGSWRAPLGPEGADWELGVNDREELQDDASDTCSEVTPRQA